MAAGLIGNRKPAEETIKDQSFIPAKKFGTDEEMSGTILYLASRAGAFCNGVALVFDGGRLSVLPSTY
jgi:NAD(P)-dependent dehydrogenase (short-subunit alcohol dehydrogenase family)